MSVPSFGSMFADIDASGDPAALGRYLARVRDVPAVGAAKRESIALMKLKPGLRALDIGCGLGTDAQEVARIVGPTGTVVGVDTSDILLAEARRAAARELRCLKFMRADATSLPLASDSFDACRADRTIQHISDADTALGEVARVLKPGGIVVMTEMLNALELDVEERREIAPAVLAGLWSSDERQSWIGFLLPPLLARSAFIEIQVHRRQERLTSFADAALLLQLPRLCELAAKTGAITSAEAQGWLAALEKDFSAGQAALNSEFLHVTARKPPSGARRTMPTD